MSTVNTIPYCGSCGWKPGGNYPNRDGDVFCDGCGADLRAFGFTDDPTPGVEVTDLAVAPSGSSAVLTWTEAPGNTNESLWSRIDGGVVGILRNPAASPEYTTMFQAGVYEWAVKSTIGGVDHWSNIVSHTFAG